MEIGEDNNGNTMEDNNAKGNIKSSSRSPSSPRIGLQYSFFALSSPTSYFIYRLQWESFSITANNKDAHPGYKGKITLC
jgi:hypothetical protein